MQWTSVLSVVPVIPRNLAFFSEVKICIYMYTWKYILGVTMFPPPQVTCPYATDEAFVYIVCSPTQSTTTLPVLLLRYLLPMPFFSPLETFALVTFISRFPSFSFLMHLTLRMFQDVSERTYKHKKCVLFPYTFSRLL